MFKSFFAFIYLILVSFSLVYMFFFNFLSTLGWPARSYKRIVLTENHIRKRYIFIFTRKLHITIAHIYKHTHTWTCTQLKHIHTDYTYYTRYRCARLRTRSYRNGASYKYIYLHIYLHTYRVQCTRSNDCARCERR